MIEIELNISQVLEQVGLMGKKLESTSEAVFAKAVDLVKINTINRTPVGKPELWKYPASPFYEPGTLKGSWRVRFDTPQSATIENLVPYAMRVEYGWSSQAPEGMLRRSLAELSKYIEIAANDVDRSYNGNTALFNSGLYDNF